MASVTLKSVSKIYGRNIHAVDRASIEIQNKEFVVLVGPSGCGKSTTLRMIAGLEEITDGEIFIGDKLVNEVQPKDRDIAMVFQNYALYPHKTVFENMAFGLKLRKYPKSEIENRVKETAAILDIEELLHRKPKELSGGQRQRVAVGRAIVRKPAVFLFDEPLSNLDARLRVQMRAEISKLHRRIETTMIYVTHDQVEAMTMGDRIVVMHKGKVQQIDTPLNLYSKPVNKFVAGFIGSPGMNFLQGEIRKNGKLFFATSTMQLELPQTISPDLQPYCNQKIILGIRPENIYSATGNEPDSKMAQSEAMVEVVEPLGNETFVYLNSGDCTYVARMKAGTVPAVGNKQKLAIDMSKAHFFDLSTEKSILNRTRQ